MTIEKKYTLSQCKRDMIMMWSWLAKTGETKNAYINFLYKNRAKSTYERFFSMVFDCPCCTYTGHDYVRGSCNCCKKCPVKWKNKYTKGIETTCCLPGSEYNDWNTSYSITTRKEKANKILELAKAIKVK